MQNDANLMATAKAFLQRDRRAGITTVETIAEVTSPIADHATAGMITYLIRRAAHEIDAEARHHPVIADLFGKPMGREPDLFGACVGKECI